jgi:hypothetical protein
MDYRDLRRLLSVAISSSTKLQRLLASHVDRIASELVLVFDGLRTAFLFEYAIISLKEAQQLFSAFNAVVEPLVVSESMLFLVNRTVLHQKIELDRLNGFRDSFIVDISGSLSMPQLIADDERMKLLQELCEWLLSAVKCNASSNSSSINSSNNNDNITDTRLTMSTKSEDVTKTIGDANKQQKRRHLTFSQATQHCSTSLLSAYLLDFPCLYHVQRQQRPELNCLAMIPLQVIGVRVQYRATATTSEKFLTSSFSYSVPSSFGSVVQRCMDSSRQTLELRLSQIVYSAVDNNDDNSNDNNRSNIPSNNSAANKSFDFNQNPKRAKRWSSFEVIVLESNKQLPVVLI